MKKTIAVLPGDGIGPEIIAEAIKVLDAVETAVNAVLDAGYRTGDILQEGCKKTTCSEMGDLVVKQL